MSTSMNITVTIVNTDGVEETRDVARGTTLANVTPEGCISMLNDETASGDTILSGGDTIELVRKSSKAGN